MLTLKKLAFNLLTKKDIHDLSVVEVKTSLCFNALDHPLKDGLYDLVMGPSAQLPDVCETCRQTARFCPGHFGHIELPLPVVNPLFHKEIFKLLKVSCKHCFKICVPSSLKNVFIYQLKLVDQGRIAEAQELTSIVSFNEQEKLIVSYEVMNNMIKEKLDQYTKGIEITSTKSTASKSTESLRRQFTHDFLKQIIIPRNCQFCKKPFKRICSVQNNLLITLSKAEIAEKYINGVGEPGSKSETTFLTPKESREMLREVWAEEKELVGELYPVLKESTEEHPTDLFFMDVILVTPPKTRPINILQDQMIENIQTRNYKNIINDCIIIKNLIKAVQNNSFDVLSDECCKYVEFIKGSTPKEKLRESWMRLQSDINILLDSQMSKYLATKGALGLKQIIEKKEGVLRSHMMGKRVNFAARSVITPDPNLQIQEIGIPEYFAKILTYPVPVTHFNVEELRTMVKNGPDVYPGASLIENENGTIVKLFGGEKYRTKREGIAKTLLKSVESGNSLNSTRKKVHRHLLNGDILLLNRQPTLHRPSIMAHKARILKTEKTIRMHYSNCKSYNADFDGDEMNAHFPQTYLGRSEGYNIVNVANHYLVPKDGTPLGGLIQDHIVSGVQLSVRSQMFDKNDYQHLVYQGLSHKPGYIKLLPPCILKPRTLWSGKQVISTILINSIPKGKELISFSGSTKISSNAWENREPRKWKCGVEFDNPNTMSESEVIVLKGNLLCGILDKQHLGATAFGLTHCLYELYGGDCCTKFLDSMGKLCTAYLQLNGFTLGVEDILVRKEVDEARKEIIKKLRNSGDEAAVKALELEGIPSDLTERLERRYFSDSVQFKTKLDQEYKTLLHSYTNEINKICLPQGLIRKFPQNNLQLMVSSGAKGSSVNTMQISCLLGQIELEGKRPPLMISGKSLPCFKAFDTDPVAGGYIKSRFMTGITPPEFFFHSMAGREGLIDTAVKTSRSGYLQRCLIKHLEGISVCYDGTVRDHDGSVIQFAYGEDGLEVQKSSFFNKNGLDFLNKNCRAVVDKSVIKQLKESTNIKQIERYKKRLLANNSSDFKRVSPFTVFSESIREKIAEKHFKKFNKATGRSKAYSKIFKKWNALSEEQKGMYKSEPRPDPVVTKYNRNSDFGAITEKLEQLIQDYVNEKMMINGKQRLKEMKNMVEAKFMLSLCQPGEPVGLLAAQSIGEPSTQMTLNTFHFAGRGEMNVTLGIPRLREVLMTASKKIKTPFMEVPLKKRKSEKKMMKNGKKLKKIFQEVTLTDVLDKISVVEKVYVDKVRLYSYNVRFHFLPYNCYKKKFSITPKDILAYMEMDFLTTLCREIRKLGKKYGDLIYETKEEKEINQPKEEENADEIDAAGTASKQIKTGEEHESSDEDEEMDDDDATKAKLRSRHQENQDYEEPEESDEGKSDEDDDDDDDEDEEEEKEEEEVEEVEDTEGNKTSAVQTVEEEPELSLTKEELVNIESRKNTILKTFAMIKNYKFDVVKEEWCEILIGIPLTLSKIDFSLILKNVCEKSVLYKVPNVKRGVINVNLSGEVILKTEGVNFVELFRLQKMLDLNRLYSNDINKIIETYGIEAGGRVIVKELQQVFGVYGITVNPRHLILIADYMTHQGYFSPFNRLGMLDSASPFQQMSFENSTTFLKSSLLRCREDDLQCPSSSIVVGKFCKTGTGCFDVTYVPQIK